MSSYLEDFPGFEEARIFLAAEGEQDVQADSVQLLLEPEPVPVPGGSRGALGAAAALPASIIDQVLLPSAERHRLRDVVGLHVCGVRVRGACACQPHLRAGLNSSPSHGLYGNEWRKCTTCASRVFSFTGASCVMFLHIYANKCCFSGETEGFYSKNRCVEPIPTIADKKRGHAQKYIGFLIISPIVCRSVCSWKL